jgi:serine phosphatase RsbU (regulator of sigma subunit)
MTRRSGILRPFLALALGAAVFAAGVALARQWLPEWQSAPLPAPSFFVQRYQALARAAGIRLDPGSPGVSFADSEKNLRTSPATFDRLTAKEAAALGGGLILQVQHLASAASTGKSGDRRELIVHFLPSGDPVNVVWGGTGEIVNDAMRSKPVASAAEQARFSRLLLRPGESLGAAGPGGVGSSPGSRFPILGSRPPQILDLTPLPGGSLVLSRQLASVKAQKSTAETVAEVILQAIPLIAGCLFALVLFFILIGRRRIDLRGGAGLGAVLLLAAAVPTLAADPSWAGALKLLAALFLALWAFVVWSAGESYLRSAHPSLTLSLDALRTGRLGPRGGRALVYGVAFGGVLAGLRLAAEAVAARLPGVWPDGGGLRLPLFGVQTPFNDGVLLAGGVALALGLTFTWRRVPMRWAAPAAALAAGLAIPFSEIHPIPFQAAVNVAAAAVLVVLCQRVGLAAALAAALTAYLLQGAAFAAQYPLWLPVALAVTTGVPALLLVLGFVGLRRPAELELEQLKQPAFMRRIEEEKRLQYEMELLARMQVGLLPKSLPQLAGWDIAARSLLATEAGGDLYDFIEDEDGCLWIAAGDVAGHGYSCSIAQAMTVAALSSLVAASQTPGGILQRVDRVLRRNTHRHFTTLALLRLDPKTGEGRLANAGHPYALLTAEGEVSEIPLAGLPLGQGPKREYGDTQVEIPPGASLVFCSDGLFEATDAKGISYGYERPREILHGLAGRPAAEILEGLLEDWRRYRGEVEQEDDTTLVVVKRV